MTDLVKRLRRECPFSTCKGTYGITIYCEAADRIEVLEKWIRDISEHTPHAWLKKESKELLGDE